MLPRAHIFKDTRMNTLDGSKSKRLVAIGLVYFAIISLAMADEPKVDFQKDIWPIIENNCIKCHREPYMKNGKMKKPKGGLRMDTAELFMKGGDDKKNGVDSKIVVPGKPEKSPFYTLPSLKPGDEDIMPPKGDPLTKKELELIKNWIQQGADFGGWKKAKLKDPT